MKFESCPWSFVCICIPTEKIKKRYGNLGNVIRVKINRTNNSMGIALAGHRNRNEMGCFIAGLNPKGAASSQNLKVGDEILEVIWIEGTKKKKRRVPSIISLDFLRCCLATCELHFTYR